MRALNGVEIVAARKAVQEKAKDSRKKKPKGDVKEEKAEQLPEGEIWEVELKDTVLFPEGRY